ncbi:MAG TPA: hypothetical protein VND64_08185 [Pirellulales bacterium]|nr:hypothetical protein [Pirellulales bacterium]
MPNITIDEAIEVLTTEIRQNLRDDTDKLLAVFNEVFPDAPCTGDKTRDSNSLIEQLVVHVNSGIKLEEVLDVWRLISPWPYNLNLWYDIAEDRLHFNELDEMQFLAMWLHVAAMETGQLREARRLIRAAWKETVEMYGLPDENEPELSAVNDPHDCFEIPRIISKFAFHWDEADRMQRTDAAPDKPCCGDLGILPR